MTSSLHTCDTCRERTVCADVARVSAASDVDQKYKRHQAVPQQTWYEWLFCIPAAAAPGELPPQAVDSAVRSAMSAAWHQGSVSCTSQTPDPLEVVAAEKFTSS